MRRWLIALFAAHFLWGVVGFALPALPDATPADTPAVAAAAALPVGAAAPSTKGLADLAHALADELPDLPDTLQRPATLALAHVLTPVQPQWRAGALPAPVLDGPFRPPRRG